MKRKRESWERNKVKTHNFYLRINYIVTNITAWKVSKYGVISGPNTGKYGPEKTPYLDTFHAATVKKKKRIKQ